MMRDYGKISPQFWLGSTGKQIKKAGLECQVVSLYLLTNPHTNMLGLYYLPVVYLSHETGIPVEGSWKALQSLREIGFCDYDEDAEFVWVFEMARFQVGESLSPNDNRVKGVIREYESLPKNLFLGRFFDYYAEQFHIERKREPESNGSPCEAPAKPLRSQEQEQEQEKEQEQNPCSGDTPHEPSGNRKKEPSGNRKRAQEKSVPCPEGVSNEVWQDVLAHRRRMKAPLTRTAWTPMEKALRELESEGWSPDDVMAEWLTAGWRAFKAEWLRNRCGTAGTTKNNKGGTIDGTSPV